MSTSLLYPTLVQDLQNGWLNDNNILNLDGIYANPNGTRAGWIRAFTFNGNIIPTSDVIKGIECDIRAKLVGGGSQAHYAFVGGYTDGKKARYSELPFGTTVLSDNNLSTNLGGTIPSGSEEWFNAIYDFSAPRALGSFHLDLKLTGNSYDLYIDGSNDDITYTNLYHQASSGGGDFSVDQTISGTYRYIRFYWNISAGINFIFQTKEFHVFDAQGVDLTQIPTGTSQIEVCLSEDGVNPNGNIYLVNVTGFGASPDPLGSNMDLLGGIWTPAKINANQFSVLVRPPTAITLALYGAERVRLPNPTYDQTNYLGTAVTQSAVYFDFVQVIIYHTASGGSFMPEQTRDSVRQRSQIGFETTPGTAVPATTRVRSFYVAPQPNPEFKEFRPQGEKLPSEHLHMREWSTATVAGIPTYDEMPILFGAGVGGRVSSGGVANTENYHSIRFDNRGQQMPGTLTAQYGEEISRAHQAKCLSLTDLGFDFSRADATLSGTMAGHAIEDGITMSGGANDIQTLTVSATGGSFKLGRNGVWTTSINISGLTNTAVQTALNVAGIYGTGGCTVTGSGPYAIEANGVAYAGVIQPRLDWDATNATGGAISVAHTTPGGISEFDLVPMLPEHVAVYLSDSYDTLSSNLMTKCTMLNWALASRQAPWWVMNRNKKDFGGFAEAPMTANFTFQAHAGSEAMALLGTSRTGAKKFLRFEAIGPNIGATNTPHSFVFDACIKVAGVSPMADADGVYLCNYTFGTVEDRQWGNSFIAKFVNGIIASRYGG